MGKEFTVIIERDEEGFFVGTVPSLKGCHTQARPLDELMERIKEAIQLCLEVERGICHWAAGTSRRSEGNFVSRFLKGYSLANKKRPLRAPSLQLVYATFR